MVGSFAAGLNAERTGLLRQPVQCLGCSERSCDILRRIGAGAKTQSMGISEMISAVAGFVRDGTEVVPALNGGMGRLFTKSSCKPVS